MEQNRIEIPTNKIKEEKRVEIKMESLKNYIKDLAKNEVSLKSISFSINEENKEFVIYFTWLKESYNKFFVERDIFRNNVLTYLSKYGFKLNKKKSNPAKYIFNG